MPSTPAPTAKITRELLPKGWVFNPFMDLAVFIITPLLLAFVFKFFVAAAMLPALKLAILGISSTGHHLPGIIRAYTDTAIFQKFRLRLILVPALFLILALVCAYFKLTFILFALFVWSIWHGLMQVLGFLRIYDAKSGFQSRMTARLDFWICLTWFIQVIFWSPARMSGVFSSFYLAGGPLLPTYPVLAIQKGWLGLTALVTIAYTARILYNGFALRYWNLPKVANLAVSIGFWSYCMIGVGNILIGLIMWEIFHDLQYNLFVWNYNRSRVAKGLSQSFLERILFRRGAKSILIYSGCIILYGCLGLFSQDMVNIYQHQGIYSTVLNRIGNVFAVSALLHFYFDGFIWKMRDQKVRRDLGLPGDATGNGLFMQRNTWLHAAMVSVFLLGGLAMATREYRWAHSPSDIDRPDNLADLVPGSGYANFTKALRLRAEGKSDSARDYFERAIGADSAYGFAEAFLGEIAVEKGRFEDAVVHFEKSVAADPANGDLKEKLGSLYMQSQAYAKALSIFEELERNDSSNYEYPFQIGFALLNQRKGLSAKPFLIRSLYLNPSQPKALNYLGMVEQALGSHDSADMLYRKALQLDSSYTHARSNLSALEAAMRPPLKSLP